jgi:rfaE bifunctional protein nucleotidyltransferase chain/domain
MDGRISRTLEEQDFRSKIKTLDELTVEAAARHAQGETIVLAHGVFDLMHIGHIRHLEQARREGDALFVTITADEYVNKGPGRPAFTAQLRAEALAALACVERVAINRSSSAENVIAALRPDVYVKGTEYADPAQDLTNKIVAEIQSVEAIGGRVVFTEDVTFSSSTLINRYLDLHDPKLKAYLAEQRDGRLIDRLMPLVDQLKTMTVLLIGDSIIDEYRYVEPLGKSPKENMIATLHRNNEVFAGGVLAAANHLADFCARVEVITCIGDGEAGYESFIRESLKTNVELIAVCRPGLPTTRKCRYVDVGYEVRKLFEVYHMDDSVVSGAIEEELDRAIVRHAAGADLIVVTDFGHGMMSPSLVETTRANAAFLAVNAQSNSANLGFNLITKYRSADYICIDQPEARLAVADNQTPIEDLVAEVLPERTGCDKLIVTRGKQGCIVYERGRPLMTIPAFTNSIVDTVGAGDAFFVVSAPFVRLGASMADVGFIGNAAGALKVGIIGHRRSVERVPFLKFSTALLK